MSRVLCRRGVARGAVSRGFSADQLLDALKGNDTEHMYVELDSGGWMCSTGPGGAARLCVCARLAPSALCAGALLSLRAGAQCLPAGAQCLPAGAQCLPAGAQCLPAGAQCLPAGAQCLPAGAQCLPAGALCLRAAADLPPHAELLLWFAEDALAALDMPFLTPRNIRARHQYVCHACAAPFDDPNPLKVHLFLSCAPFEPERFWREVVSRLRAERPATPPSPPPLAPARLPPPSPLAPAALEALATEWGRARGGHVCVYCGKLYSRRYGLKIHLRTHTGYRPLRCRHCLRAFGDPSNLNKHERLHAARAGAQAAQGARYTCPLCGRALARRRDLERHVRTHTHTHTLTQLTQTAEQ